MTRRCTRIKVRGTRDEGISAGVRETKVLVPGYERRRYFVLQL